MTLSHSLNQCLTSLIHLELDGFLWQFEQGLSLGIYGSLDTNTKLCEILVKHALLLVSV